MEMERPRIKDFNAQKCAPNFLRFLGEQSEVEVGEEGQNVARYGLSNEMDLHHGLAKPVYLKGELVWELEVYVDPPVVGYEGKLPNVPEPKGRGHRTHQVSQVDTNGVAWTDVSIYYHGKHPKADKEEGRSDGWTTIPLPWKVIMLPEGRENRVRAPERGKAAIRRLNLSF